MPSVITIADIAAALDICAHARRQIHKEETLRDLFHKCGGDAAQLEQLLRVLLPSHDRKHVYGLKTRKLMQLVLPRVQLLAYEPSPVLSSDLSSYYYYNDETKDDADDNDDDDDDINNNKQAYYSSKNKRKHIVCMPEFFIASKVLSSRQDEEGQERAPLSALGDICEQLTRAYLENGYDLQQIEALQKAVFETSALRFDFTEWVLLARLILKRVTMGVGPATVMAAMPYLPNAAALWARQHDFRVIAEKAAAAAAAQGEGNEDHLQLTEVRCGVPIVPMTCDVMSSPYLLKWLFSREELLEKPLTPIDGRLFIRDDAHWFVPLTSLAPNNLRLVNLDEEGVLHLRSRVRSRHLRLLRMFKKAKMLVAAKAVGLLIHYTLSVDSERLAVLLVRDVSDAINSGVELAEGGELPPSVLAEEDDNDDNQRRRRVISDGRRKELLNALIARPQQGDEDEGQSEVSYVGKQALKILVASSRDKPRRKPPPRPPPQQPNQQQQPKNTTAQAVASRVAAAAAAIASSRAGQTGEWGSRLRPRGQEQPPAPPPPPPQQQQQANRRQNGEVKEGIIAQVKYDGDRLQAHVISATEVKLFTRWGVDVTELYSNITDALKSIMEGRTEFPCIFDGELVLIDTTSPEAPLQWSSEKWKYNRRNDDGVVDSALLTSLLAENQAQEEEDEHHQTLIILENDDLALRPSEDYDDDVISFLPLNARSATAQLRSVVDMTATRARKLDEHKRLQFVVFDVVMWQGRDVSRSTYETRLRMLVSFFESAKKVQSVILIPNGDRRVKTAAELVVMVREITTGGWEGCVLKDPSSAYRFERTRAVQKVKLGGPEINAGVVGLGFSLSTNPRRWGLLTAIELEEEGGALVTYCRTEVLEGDRLHRAFQHVHKDLQSTVSVKKLLSGGRNINNNTAEVLLENYKVTRTQLSSSGGSKIEKVEWIPRSAQARACTLLVLPDALQDIQWLCNPHECAFSLSLKGDIRPLERPFHHHAPSSSSSSNENDGAPSATTAMMIMIPRHPVGRIEIGTNLAGSIDNIESAAKKFDDAIDIFKCVEMHTLRSIARTRALPASRQRLEEIGRIARGWLSCMSAVATDEGEKWPQMPPTSLSMDGLSNALTTLAQKLKTRENMQDGVLLVDKALCALTLAERQAMAMLPSASQWVRLDSIMTNRRRRDADIMMMVVQDEADAIDAAEAESHVETRTERFRFLKNNVKPPVIMAQARTAFAYASPPTLSSSSCSIISSGTQHQTLDTLFHGIKPFAPPGFTSMPLIAKQYSFQQLSYDEEGN